MSSIRIYSGGAAHGIVSKLAPAFTAATGFGIDGTFSAVGGLKARILAGERPDLVILTAAIVAEFERLGITMPGESHLVGHVTTAVALKADAPAAQVATEQDVKALLLNADAIYFPDPELATAGIHFANVLRRLGIFEGTSARHRTFPNGATAMAALAASPDRNPVGCTQLTEIVSTPGIRSIGDLPGDLGLSTAYTAAVVAGSEKADAASWLASALASSEHATARAACGFA
ncbi:MAG: molybdate ABC transporter substrate-binding protein [Beijerinckiaceae bacterium]